MYQTKMYRHLDFTFSCNFSKYRQVLRTRDQNSAINQKLKGTLQLYFTIM